MRLVGRSWSLSGSRGGWGDGFVGCLASGGVDGRVCGAWGFFSWIVEFVFGLVGFDIAFFVWISGIGSCSFCLLC